MKLIATLGTTPAKFKHRYLIEDTSYLEYFSFLALKKHFDIADSDVVIIGTEQTLDKHKGYIAPFRFEKVRADDLESVFQKSVESVEKGDIVDLTQSFRSLSFGMLLALSFSKSLGKRPADIFYAQITDDRRNPAKESAAFRFLSLMRFDGMTDMARLINTFASTLMVPSDIVIYERSHRELYVALRELSRDIFDNNTEELFETLRDARRLLRGMLNDASSRYLHMHLHSLDRLLENLAEAKKDHISETLLAISAFLADKGIALQAVTTLYESIVAFLDEELDIAACNEKEKKGKKTSVYERRNCLKKKLGDCMHLPHLVECGRLSKLLRDVDRLRNIAAHAYAYDTTPSDIVKTVKATGQTLSEIYRKRLSSRSDVQKLTAVFQNR
jgi:hypothetical protein